MNHQQRFTNEERSRKLMWLLLGRYLDDMTSERVDAQGVANVAQALKAALGDAAVCLHAFSLCMHCLPATNMHHALGLITGYMHMHMCWLLS